MAFPRAIDKRYLVVLVGLEEATRRLLASTGKDIEQAARDHSNAQEINVKKLEDELEVILAEFAAAYLALMVTGIGRVIDVRAHQAASVQRDLLRAGRADEVDRFRRQITDYRKSVSRRLLRTPSPIDGRTLLGRVTTIRTGALKTARNIIAVELKKGTDPRRIAYMLRNYVVPTEPARAYQRGRLLRPWEAARERLNRPTTYRPKGVPSGSVQYNSMRIARTEAANAYRDAALEFYGDKDWVDGFDWVLSATHKGPDDCDDLAAASPYTAANVPTHGPHPNCFCDIRPRINVRARAAAGV